MRPVQAGFSHHVKTAPSRHCVRRASPSKETAFANCSAQTHQRHKEFQYGFRLFSLHIPSLFFTGEFAFPGWLPGFGWPDSGTFSCEKGLSFIAPLPVPGVFCQGKPPLFLRLSPRKHIPGHVIAIAGSIGSLKIRRSTRRTHPVAYIFTSRTPRQYTFPYLSPGKTGCGMACFVFFPFITKGYPALQSIPPPPGNIPGILYTAATRPGTSASRSPSGRRPPPMLQLRTRCKSGLLPDAGPCSTACHTK